MFREVKFNRLSHSQKVEYLRARAIFLAKWVTFHYDIRFHYSHNFYVDTLYRKMDHRCEYISSFYTTTWIYPFLKEIQLNLG